MLPFNIAGSKITASLDHQMSAGRSPKPESQSRNRTLKPHPENYNDQAHHLDTRRRHRAQLRFVRFRCPEAESEPEGPGAGLLHAGDRRKLISTSTQSTNDR